MDQEKPKMAHQQYARCIQIHTSNASEKWNILYTIILKVHIHHYQIIKLFFGIT
jgi:hypothetical protein